ncbi:MAG: 5-(carboxyamino)imidazole ribonucleotide synthase [Pseudomonadales bacterium]
MAPRIGILGAGQLGGYLCIAARGLGIESAVLAGSSDEMAAGLADQVILESDNGIADALQLAAHCDIIVFEKEDVQPAVLEALRERELAGDIRIAPSVDTLLLLQNKALQKRWLSDQGFPTAQYMEIDRNATGADIRAAVGSPFVVKTERGGYDGLGVRVIREGDDDTRLGEIPSIAERFIGERRELAVLVVREHSGDSLAYPAVEMVFDPVGNLLRTIVAPANINAELAAQAQALATDVIDRLGSIGAFAVELFLTDEALLVNEISPRVHNSGHHTLDACPTSQFEQHLRAVTHMPLGPIEPMRPAALINLLCEPPLHHVCCSDQQSTNPVPDVFVHWYGKKSLRHLRKMGHMTALAETTDQALKLAQTYWDSMAQPTEETTP